METRVTLKYFVHGFNYQILFIKSKCSKEKLSSSVISIFPNFFAEFVQKISMTKIKLLSVTFVKFGFILNVTILIVQITGIFKTFEILQHNINSLSTPYQATKPSSLVVPVLIVMKNLWNDRNNSLLLKPSTNSELLVNQFNNTTPENSNDP